MRINDQILETQWYKEETLTKKENYLIFKDKKGTKNLVRGTVGYYKQYIFFLKYFQKQKTA